MSEQTDTSVVVNGLLSRVRESTERLTEIRHCSGTYALTNNTGSIAYRKSDAGTEASWFDFTSPNLIEADLQGLVHACDAATFGRGDEDVLDPTYRKAWKLDTSRFAAQFDVVQSGLLDAIHDELLRFNDNSLKINAHYTSPGSHFKSHLDTPRSDKMFGSLVIIFPTEHVGGDLTLRFKDTAWTFESSKMLSKSGSAASEPGARLAWVAFYSDIEHEVTTVESGYRISLTYNLYYSKDTAPSPLPAVAPSPPEENALRASLMELLSSPLVLPDGGALGFGLTYQYPIVKNVKARRSNTSIASISDILKGTDALVKRVCSDLGLECQVKALYDLCGDDWEEDYGPKADVYLTDRAYGDGSYEEYMGEKMDEAPNLRVIDAFAGKEAEEAVHDATRSGWGREPKILAPVVRVLWATPANTLNAVETTVVTHGNEPGVGWFYASLVLVAMIPSYETRSQVGITIEAVA